jgi:Icc-related predicted phosphoesterase
LKLKILVFSDLHDDEEALLKISKIAPNYDLVLGCGDLCETNSFYDDLSEKFSSLKNFYFISGNTESEYLNLEYSKNSSFVHGKKITLECGLNLCGFGFSTKTPYGTFGEISEDEFEKGLSSLALDTNSILLLHSPPFGHFDLVKENHIGSKSILKTILEKSPLVCFFGHVHSKVGFSTLGKTHLIKLPPANSGVVCTLTISSSLSGKNLYCEFVRL